MTDGKLQSDYTIPVFFLIGWTALLTGLMLWGVRETRQHAEALALSNSRAFFLQVIITRLWNAEHGGVYVVVNDSTQPNPYLDDPDRDIALPDGRLLTKINPALMTRQIAEIAERHNGIQFHITSLNPIRPANAPAAWEAAALKSFEQGAKEYFDFPEAPAGKQTYRYMAPLYTKPACISCHGSQGYKVGDLRGGISVVTPADALFASQANAQRALCLSFGLIWTIGFLGIFFGSRSILHGKHRAEAANRAKSEFLANISHEIRTPLNAVLGFSELLVGSGLREKQLHYATTIKKSAAALLGTINDLLDLSKIESGKLSIEQASFSLRATVDGLIDSLEVIASAKGLALTCSIDPSVPLMLRGDQSRLRQVLTNLIGNAIKFTHSGSVTLTVHTAQDGAQTCTILFAVADTGIGIPPGQQQRIFERFTQQDASTTRTYGGSGLGLAISKELVELMGGAISLQSTPGSGSTFRFAVTFEKEPPFGPQPGTPPARAGCERILVAEDNETNRLLVVELLAQKGLSADIALNGSEALAACEMHDYDLILMDIQMPVMDGLEATRYIRRLEKDRGKTPARIVALTAHMADEDLQRCLDAGMDEFIEKPLSSKKLAGALGVEKTPANPVESPAAVQQQHPQTPLLNTQAALGRLDGNLALYRKIITKFSETMPGYCDQLTDACVHGDAERVRRIGHTIKGAAAAIGAAKLQDTAQGIEHAGQTNTIETASRMSGQLRDDYHELAKSIQAFLAAHAEQ